MKPAGYLLNTQQGLVGERGLIYDYVLASNGLWIEAEGQFMAARILTAPAEVRGLLPLEQKVVLRHGPIEAFKLELLLNLFSVNPSIEHYAAITWDGSKYDIACPEQEAGASSVKYLIQEEAVMDVHSHGSMGAFFSGMANPVPGTDNYDEQRFRLYAVLGHADTDTPEFRLRVGVYGYFQAIKLADVLDGPVTWLTDKTEDNDDLYGSEHDDEEQLLAGLKGLLGRLRRHRWIRSRGPL